MRLLALIIYVLAELQPDGSACITEQWDIDAVQGTEIYLTRENLGDIGIYGFSVSENGREFINEGSWDINRDLEGKRGRCGMVTKRNGYELCWGIGSYGHHDFTVNYRMTNAVKSLEDYDKLHLQFVSPGIQPTPDEVKVEIKAPVRLDADNCRLWGFGYNGTSGFSDEGTAVFNSTEPFRRNSSVIALLRFDKGIFHSGSIEDHNFGEDLEKALEGASFSDDEDEPSIWDILAPLLTMIAFVLGTVVIASSVRKANKEKVLGCTEKEIKWYRDIPCDGDLMSADYILERLGEGGRNTVAAALILRMINSGLITVMKSGSKDIELSFNPSADLSVLSPSEAALYNMMKEAGGRDGILQKDEFRRWSSRHSAAVSRWADSVKNEGRDNLRGKGHLDGKNFTRKGQESARNLVGFRNFLKDFTLVKERYSNEVGVWHELLIFAALFGIAEKVAEELKEINPEAFEEVFTGGYDTTLETLRRTRMMADSITNARAANSTAGMSRGGFGGVSSFGGGGGFSGGGFGGGTR